MPAPDIDQHAQTQWLTLRTERPVETLELTAKAVALESATPEWTLDTACRAHLVLGEAREAIATCERASGLNPNNWAVQLLLVAAYMSR